MPTYSEKYCDPVNGSNLNAGDDAGSPSMSDTAGTGSVSTVTHQYTSVATNGAVSVGQFISIYSGAATVPAFIARITAVSGGSGSAWVISYSTTAISGTEPTTASTYKAQVGGAWKGPSAAVTFPFNFLTKAATDAAADPVRCNLKNNGTYNVTAASTITSSANMDLLTYQGYSSSPGDGGVAVIDGGTSGASFSPLTVGAAALGVTLRDLRIQNNGATGSAAGLITANSQALFERVTACNVRGAGFTVSGTTGLVANNCEAFNCNQSNTATTGGFLGGAGGAYLRGCISHHNTGTNNCGFVGPILMLVDCIADSNGLHGIFTNTATGLCQFNFCTSSNNGGDGIRNGVGTAMVDVINCLFVSNTGTGVNQSSAPAAAVARVANCAFYNNGAQTAGINDVSGSITLTGNPFADTTGNFGLNNIASVGASCRGAGFGIFIETANRTGNVTGATNANPIVITTDQPHGMATGGLVTITGVLGNTAANVAASAITNLSATTFSVAVTGNGAYTSGGAWSTPQYSTTTTAYPDIGAAQTQVAYPTAAQVQSGVTFDVNAPKTGTYTGSGGGSGGTRVLSSFIIQSEQA